MKTVLKNISSISNALYKNTVIFVNSNITSTRNAPINVMNTNAVIVLYTIPNNSTSVI